MDILQLLKYSKTSDFSIRNLPFGIILENGHYTVVSRLGIMSLMCSFIHIMGLEEFTHIPEEVFINQCLTDFIALARQSLPHCKASGKNPRRWFSESVFKRSLHP